MSSAGFVPAVPTIKRLQTYALDRTATGIGIVMLDCINYYYYIIKTINTTGHLPSRHKTMILPVISCWWQTESVTTRKEHQLKVFQNRSLKTMFGRKESEVGCYI